VYAAELREAAPRICKVPYVVGKPVHAAWDLGHADSTSIWFYQVAGLGEVRVIDFLQNNQKKMAFYLAELQKRGYVYGTMFMPHDAESEHLSADKTPAGLARAAGFQVRVLPRTPINIGIDAARTLFPNAWFDQQKCADGIHALRHYKYDVDPDSGQFSRQPLHDEHSHAADAFRYLAIAFKEPKKERKNMPAPVPGNWMAA
jgi:phage terminase large subunit